MARFGLSGFNVFAEARLVGRVVMPKRGFRHVILLASLFYDSFLKFYPVQSQG
jgi:hypothetical protein